MNRRLALITAAIALLSARRAAAQTAGPEVSIGYQGLPYKAMPDSKTGVNLAEGVLLHFGAGAEAGYDSNVFYGSSSVPGAVVGSGILRFNAFGEITNASRGGGSPSLGYDIRAGLTYRRYTSSNPAVQLYNNAFMPSAGLSLGTASGKWSFQLTDSFLRQEDPPYLGVTVNTAAPITRDSNLAGVQAGWSPGGGRINMTLRYTNAIDIFEQSSGFSYANSLTNNLMLDISWKWLPKTAVFFQANQGWVTYLSDNTNGKVSSFPLRVYAGLRGLITPKFTALAALGYANGFYSSGATTNGFWGSTYIDLQGIFTPTLLSRVTVGYHQDFVNSVISNFYYQYSGYVSYVQQLGGRLALDVSGRASYLDYKGLLFVSPVMPETSRTDVTLTGGVTLDYFLRSWIYAGVGYSLATDFTDYKLIGIDPVTGARSELPVDFVKQQVFARLGVTY